MKIDVTCDICGSDVEQDMFFVAKFGFFPDNSKVPYGMLRFNETLFVCSDCHEHFNNWKALRREARHGKEVV